MIDQAEWGSTKIYDDGGLSGAWNPKLIVLHWGGLTRQVEPDEEAEILRGWQRFHINKGWRDIAYNYAVGDSGEMYRCRGENPSGATSGTSPDGDKWNSIAVNIVWIGGKNDEDGPSEDAISTLVQGLDSRGLPVLGHVETGKATACPGPDLLKFGKDYNNGEYAGVEPLPVNEGDYDMPTLKLYAGYKSKDLYGQRHSVKALQIMLASHGFVDARSIDGTCGADGYFGPGTQTAVKSFQKAKRLTVDGIVGGKTWDALA